MDIKTPFAHPDETPAVGVKLSEDTERWHDGLHRVDIERKYGTGYKQVNSLKLSQTGPGRIPKEDVDEVSIGIMLCAYNHYEELGEPGTYRGKFHRCDEHGKQTRRHSSFKVPGTDGDSDPVAEPEDELNWLRNQAVVQVEQTKLQMEHNQLLVDRILEQSRNSDGTVSELRGIIKDSLSAYREGMRMQIDANIELARSQYDQKALEVEDDKSERFSEMYGPALRYTAKQVVRAASKVAGLDQDDDDDDDDDDDELDDDERDEDPDDNERRRRPKERRTKKRRTKRRTKRDDEDPKSAEDPESPKPAKGNMQRSVRGFTEHLLADQWFDLEEQLKEREWNWLKKAQRISTGKKKGTEKDIANCIASLYKSVLSDIPSALKLQKILTDDQFDLLEKISALATKTLEEDGDADADAQPDAKTKKKAAKKKAAKKPAKKKTAKKAAKKPAKKKRTKKR